METRISTKGQVVLPKLFRRRLDLRVSDPLEVNIEGGCIILRPQKRVSRKVSIVTDPVTRLPVISLGKDAPVLTNKDVEDILSVFP